MIGLRAVVVSVAALAVVSALSGCGTSGHASSNTTKAKAPPKCKKYAGLNGRDPSPGSSARPFRTVERLAGSLRPGQVGCLLPGTYSEDVSIHKGGRPGKPIVITSAGRPALVKGTFWVADDANDVVVTRLRLYGTSSGQPSPQINGDRVVFRDNDVTNGHTGICFSLGGDFADYGFAYNTVIESNRIHDCGRLPRTNHDHGIYVEGSRGARIVRNLIYGNADWGVHLYPEADRTYIAQNVIDGNGGGVIVAGEDAGGEYSQPHSSDHNLITSNVISNSTAMQNIAVYWGGPVGVGNVARRNCVWHGTDGNVISEHPGLVTSGNFVANPRFVNRGGANFRLRPGSRCRRTGAGRR